MNFPCLRNGKKKKSPSEKLYGTWICKVLLYFNNYEWSPSENHHFTNSSQQDIHLGTVDLEVEMEAFVWIQTTAGAIHSLETNSHFYYRYF